MTIDGEPGQAILALDFGEVRIGAAVSESRVIATTLPAIEGQGKRQALDAIEELTNRYAVGIIVVGLPLLESGIEGSQAERTRAFGRSLARRLPRIRIEFRDERYTTAEAREILGPGEIPKGRVDSVAAAIILQEYLDCL